MSPLHQPHLGEARAILSTRRPGLGARIAIACGWVVGFVTLGASAQAGADTPASTPPAALVDARPEELPGGRTTVYATGRNAFSFPAANLSDAERTRFAIGNSFFRRNWVEAPSSTQARDGLGPHFIARSCGGCHVQDGRGAPPDFRKGLHEPPVALLMRLSVPGVGPRGGVVPDPVYGDQLDNAAVSGVRPEGQVRIRLSPVRGRFADGSRYTLHRPDYRLIDLAYGPLHPGLMLSPRIAPQLIGVGLLEAIPEAEILANAKAQADAGGAIRGVPNQVWDAMAQAQRIGRFGWKANVATIAHQTAGAFLGDMGITSPLNPGETCTTAQKDCLAAPRGGQGAGPEIDADTLDKVIFYQAVLAPPARRSIDDAQVRRGERLFHQAQCASCHRPGYVTGTPPFPRLSSPALEGQAIFPYTDLLLHDMGEGLADHRPDFAATGRQWKTPPLWGVGLIRDVNGHQRLLHDGRADGVLEAVLWHDGEARASREAVKRWSSADRKALVKFVESL